ncbi:O-antigen ligase family protein [Thioclava indica]|uniref:O-antigen ligase family protein n=1 Tax=Thioclava indica TaxID=1353528 RepID=UPI0012DEED61|nr:O-antigen ligase family protein [Thioclava indica]
MPAFTSATRSALPANGRPARRHAVRLSWRALEWWGVAIALFLLSGAVFPLLLMVQSGSLGDSERGVLRLLQIPVIAITVILLGRHLGALLLAIRRTLPMFMLALLAFTSTFWSIAPSITLRRAIALMAAMLLAYLLAIRFTPRQLLVLFSSILGACLGLSLIAGMLAPQIAFMPDDTGLRGIYTHKNVLGWAASLAFILALGLMADAGGRLFRRGVALLLASIACLVLSQSSTSLLAAITGLTLFGFYTLLQRKRGLARALLVLVALQLAALCLLFLGEFLVPVLESLGRDTTLTGRVPLWHLVDGYIGQRPWQGYGYGAFWSAANPAKYVIEETLQWIPPHAHNGYRDMLLNFGVPGLVLLMLTIARAIRRGGVLLCAQPEAGWAWMNVSIGVMVVLNLSESNFLAQNDIQSLMMMTVIAMFGLRAPR